MVIYVRYCLFVECEKKDIMILSYGRTPTMKLDEDFVSETRNVPWVYILLRIENLEVISILRKI